MDSEEGYWRKQMSPYPLDRRENKKIMDTIRKPCDCLEKYTRDTVGKQKKRKASDITA